MSRPSITAGFQSYGNDLLTVTTSTSTAIKALDFDGVGDYVTLGNPASLQITSNLSVCGWCECGSQGPYDYLFMKWLSTGNQGSWLVRTEAGARKIGIQLSDDGTTNAGHYKSWYSTNDVLPASGWAFVAASFSSAGVVSVKINDVEVSAWTKGHDAAITSLHNSTRDARISTPGGPWVGRIFNVSIWDTAVLSAADVTALYNSGTPVDPASITPTGGANLVSSYIYNTSMTYPTVADNTGSNDGTMTSMTAGDIVDSPWSETTITATDIGIADGWYDAPTDVASALETELQAISGWGSATVTAPTVTAEEWEIDSAHASFDLAWTSTDLRGYMGFADDLTGASSYTSRATVGSSWFPLTALQDVTWRRVIGRRAARDHTGYTAAIVWGTHDRLLATVWIERTERANALAVLLRLRSGDRGQLAIDESNANTWAWTSAAWTGVMNVSLAPGNQDLSQWLADPSSILRSVDLDLVRW